MKKSHSANDSEEFFREDDGGGDPAPQFPPPPRSLLTPFCTLREPGGPPGLGWSSGQTDSRQPRRGAPSRGRSVAGSWHLISGLRGEGSGARSCVLHPLPLRGALWPCRPQRGIPWGSPALRPEPGRPSLQRPPGRLRSPRSHPLSPQGLPAPLSAPGGPHCGSGATGGWGHVYQRAVGSHSRSLEGPDRQDRGRGPAG